MTTTPIAYIGSFDEVTITAAGPNGLVEILVPRGETFDCPDWLAPGLLAQPANWATPATPSKKKNTTGDGENGATP